MDLHYPNDEVRAYLNGQDKPSPMNPEENRWRIISIALGLVAIFLMILCIWFKIVNPDKPITSLLPCDKMHYETVSFVSSQGQVAIVGLDDKNTICVLEGDKVWREYKAKLPEVIPGSPVK